MSSQQVTAYLREDVLWGFTVAFLKDGASATDIRVAFDEQITLKHEWVGRGQGALSNVVFLSRVISLIFFQLLRRRSFFSLLFV